MKIASPTRMRNRAEMEKFIFKKVASGMALWLIMKKERTGYELIKMFEKDDLAGMAVASRIYPLLGRLEKTGLIGRKAANQGRRKSYVYRITPSGKLVLSRISEHLSHGLKGEFFRDMVKTWKTS